MKTSLTTCFAFIACLVPTVFAQSYYLLQAQSAKAKGPYNNFYVSSFHTGAGQAAAVLVAKKADARPAFLNNTIQNFQGANGIPYSFHLSPPSKAAAGYNYVAIDAGLYTPGFKLAPRTHALTWSNATFDTFAVCKRVLPEYPSLGAQAQLFWRSKHTARNASCTDVTLRALPTKV